MGIGSNVAQEKTRGNEVDMHWEIWIDFNKKIHII